MYVSNMCIYDGIYVLLMLYIGRRGEVDVWRDGVQQDLTRAYLTCMPLITIRLISVYEYVS